MSKYTTPEAAKLIGVSQNTIRSWMSRYPGYFIQDVHFQIEDTGRKLWLEEGIEFLKTCPPTVTTDAVDEESDAADTMLEPLLEEASKQLAVRFWQELPMRTLQRIQRMREQPTPEEMEVMQQSVDDAIKIGTFQLLPNYIKGLPDGET